MRAGDFSVRMTGDHLGIEGKIADTFNEIVAANQRMAQQLEHVGQVVGREGKTRQRVKFDLSSGSWADSVRRTFRNATAVAPGSGAAPSASVRRIATSSARRCGSDSVASSSVSTSSSRSIAAA